MKRHGAGIFLLFVMVASLGIFLKHRAITQTSPTFDEPSPLFEGVFQRQKKYWYHVDPSNPPLFSWIMGRISPWVANFGDVDQFMDSKDSFFGELQYRIDEFSGLPGDEAFQRARWIFQFFWLLLGVSALWLARRFGMGRWGLLSLFSFLALEPFFVGFSAILKHDLPTVAFLTLGTALSLSEWSLGWLAALAAFSCAWALKMTSCFWLLPLAIGLVLRKLPERTFFLWALGFVGGVVWARWLGFPALPSEATDPTLRLTYLDGILFQRTPYYYYLQAFLCKVGLGAYAMIGYALWRRKHASKKPWLVWAMPVVFVGSLLGAAWILPGLGIRLALPIVLPAVFFAAFEFRTPKPALVVLCLLAFESFINRDALLAYQNPLAGSEARLLDSNRDWGQGLKELAEWRKTHTDAPLALALFGGAMPETYGLKEYRRLPSFPELSFGEPLNSGEFKGYVAASENLVHGYPLDDPSLRQLARLEPLECFQGVLCVYDVRTAR